MKLRDALLCLLGAALLGLAACAAPPAPPPAPPKIPSQVTTQEGVRFQVYGVRIPGTRQELKLREGGAITWLPLAVIQSVRLSGPVKNQFRPAAIVLTSGEKFQGELFVGHLIEGTTDIGYWNMPLDRVRQLVMGQD